MSTAEFPPLLTGLDTAGSDPFEAAITMAGEGCDAGTILYDAAPHGLRAAIVLAPDVTLSDAAIMFPLAGVAVQNALGALGPAELPVHLEWGGAIRVNGGLCGGLRMASHTTDADTQPDWLVVGVVLPFLAGGEGGDTPDETALYAEGCGGLEPQDLLHSWARHFLAGLHRWEEDGVGPLHRDWTGLAHAMGETIVFDGQHGTFLGVDERLGLLMKSGGETRLYPLTHLVEER